MSKYTLHKRICIIVIGIVVWMISFIAGMLSLPVERVKALQYNYTGQASSSGTSDPVYEQWGLFGENGIQVEDAWEIAEVNPDIRVGVIDTGITEHKALNVDTSLGWCFCCKSNERTDDVDGHGTHIAGIIGANGEIDGVYGVAPGVKIVPLSIQHNHYVWYESIIIDAIEYATSLYWTENRIDILNFSGIYFAESERFKKAVDNFPGLFVNSVGNKNEYLNEHPNYPTCFDIDNMITVGGYSGKRDTVSPQRLGIKLRKRRGYLCAGKQYLHYRL